MGKHRVESVIAVTLLFACTADDGNNNPFGVTSVGTTVTTVTTTTPVTGDSSSSGTGASSEGSSGSVAESSSTGDVDEGSSGTTMPADGSSDDGSTGGSNGMQPADGMYSPCTVPMDCGVVPALCITITDMMMMPIAGFCSETSCANPAVDCDPTPGGTATPTCMPVELDGEPDMACALDCAGGATCPAPMMCRPLAGLSVCA